MNKNNTKLRKVYPLWSVITLTISKKYNKHVKL